MQGDDGASSASQPAAYGAVRASGLSTMALEAFMCSGVRDANGWACLLLQFISGAEGTGTSLAISNSTISGNSVVPRNAAFWQAGDGDASFPLADASIAYGAVVLAPALDGTAASAFLGPRIRVVGASLSDNTGGFGAAIAAIAGLAPVGSQCIMHRCRTACGSEWRIWGKRVDPYGVGW